MNVLTKRIRPEHEAQASAILQAVREQITFPDTYGVLLEGSVAEGLGTPGSDLDITIVPEPGHTAPRGNVTGIFDGPHGPQIMDIEFKTVEQLSSLAQAVAAADADTAGLEALVIDGHRIHHGFPLLNPESIDRIRAAFDGARIARVYHRYSAACARARLERAAALERLGLPRCAVDQAREAVIWAAEAWLAARGDTYAIAKWQVPRLRRAHLNPGLLERVQRATSVFFGASSQTVLQECQTLLSALTGPSKREAGDIAVERSPDVVTWANQGRLFLLREGRELYVLGADAARAWTALNDPLSLTRAIEQDAADGASVRALGQLYRHGFVTLRQPTGERWASVEAVVDYNAVARLSARGVELAREPAAAVEAIAVCPRRLAGAGMMLVQGLIGAENAKEDALGACLAGEWGVFAATLRMAAHRTCRALLGSCLVYPAPYGGDLVALFEQAPGVPEPWREIIRKLDRIEVTNRADARAAYEALLPLLRTASAAISDPAIDRCYRRAEAYLAAIQLGLGWAILGRVLGMRYPHPMGNRMLDAVNDSSAGTSELIAQITSGGSRSQIKVEDRLFERLFSAQRDLDLDRYFADVTETAAPSHGERSLGADQPRVGTLE